MKRYLQTEKDAYTVLGVPQQCDVYAKLAEYEMLTQAFVDSVAICYSPVHVRREWEDVVCQPEFITEQLTSGCFGQQHSVRQQCDRWQKTLFARDIALSRICRTSLYFLEQIINEFGIQQKGIQQCSLAIN